MWRLYPATQRRDSSVLSLESSPYVTFSPYTTPLPVIFAVPSAVVFQQGLLLEV